MRPEKERQQCAPSPGRRRICMGHGAREPARGAQFGIRDALNRCMDQETLETFRRTLLQRQHSLMERRQHALAAKDDLLIEPELDPEDTAAAGSAAALLDSLGETARLALFRLEAALGRIQRGGYGSCSKCGQIIDGERLRAVPDTDQCSRCAFAP